MSALLWEAFKSASPAPLLTLKPNRTIEVGDRLVIIKPDGTIEFGPEYTPDEAARMFWAAVASLNLGWRCDGCGSEAVT